MTATVASIKKDLQAHIGSQIQVVVQIGSKRKGILTQTYPAVFVVDLDPEENAFERVSYSYSDILTKTVEIEYLPAI